MLALASQSSRNTAHSIQNNSKFLALAATIALAFSALIIAKTYTSSYNINFRYFYILGASCVLDLAYLAFRSCKAREERARPEAPQSDTESRLAKTERAQRQAMMEEAILPARLAAAAAGLPPPIPVLVVRGYQPTVMHFGIAPPPPAPPPTSEVVAVTREGVVVPNHHTLSTVAEERDEDDIS